MPSRMHMVHDGTYNMEFNTPVASNWNALRMVRPVTTVASVVIVDQDDTHIMIAMQYLPEYGPLLVEKANIKEQVKNMREEWIPVNLAGWYHRPTPGLPGM